MYIGIIGHTGDDKLKLSQLIGETVNWIATHKEEKKNPSFDFCLHFYEWCDELDKMELSLILVSVYITHPSVILLRWLSV